MKKSLYPRALASCQNEISGVYLAMPKGFLHTRARVGFRKRYKFFKFFITYRLAKLTTCRAITKHKKLVMAAITQYILYSNYYNKV